MKVIVPADEHDARLNLAALIERRRDDYANLSRMLGRGNGYLRKWVRDGSPKRLADEDRQTLARYFGVDAGQLGAAS